MDSWRRWTLKHPVIFAGCVIGVALVLGIFIPSDPLYWLAAFASGLGWQIQAATALGSRGTATKAVTSASAPPPSSMPTTAHVLLPAGQKIQVTKEENYPDTMGELLAGLDERHIAATLHRIPPPSARSTKERVEVRINGMRVGELTVYMSEHFLPLIRACEDQGIAVVSRAAIKGNQLKSDVVLDATKAIDLSDAWIQEHVFVAVPPASHTD
ncbi:MAG: hypothetical protein Q4P15_12900 [Propionibacteriaceae bacterium]|nr:hypothetical protein [Propionibacteriaceae bacterium]